MAASAPRRSVRWRSPARPLRKGSFVRPSATSRVPPGRTGTPARDQRASDQMARSRRQERRDRFHRVTDREKRGTPDDVDDQERKDGLYTHVSNARQMARWVEEIEGRR